MRVITYARVSTKSQSDRGTSLADQEKRFSEWLERSGHLRVRAYAEAMSGGKNMQERTFQGMLEDLPHLGAEALVVDSLDRFTRDKIAGTAMTHQLREMGVKVWELEYPEERPFDLTVDEHRDYIVQRFNDAEAERRRIKKRQLKRYKEQKQRGAATTNRPAFGLRLAGDRKGHRRLEPDPDTASIVNEVDRRIIAGQSQNKVLEWLKPIKAWGSRRGLTSALNDKHGGYVAAGVRTPEVQHQLRELLGNRKQSYGEDRSAKSRRRHELSGLVACALCVAADVPPEEALMHGRYIVANEKNHPYSLVCDGIRTVAGEKKRIHKSVWVSEHKVIELVVRKLRWLRDPSVAQKVFERWSKEPKSDRTAKLRRSLERQIADCDEREATLEKGLSGAFVLVAEGGPGAAEAKRHIANAEKDRMAIEVAKAALSQKLSQLPAARAVAFSWQELRSEAERIFEPASGTSENVEAWIDAKGRLQISGTNIASVREPFAKWVKAIGPPQLLRRRKPYPRGLPGIALYWPFLDKLPKKWAPTREYDPEADATDWPDEHGPWDELPWDGKRKNPV